ARADPREVRGGRQPLLLDRAALGRRHHPARRHANRARARALGRAQRPDPRNAVRGVPVLSGAVALVSRCPWLSRRRIAPVIALLLTSAPVLALDPARAITQYRYEAWNTREGLPQSSVESLLQTRDGYLWLGTQEGLARFDGQRFVVFDRSNTRELHHNRVLSLHQDAAGALWIGTEGGGLTRLRDGVFQSFGMQDGLPGNRVRVLASDRDGTVWVGTTRGLYRVPPGQPQAVELPIPGEGPVSTLWLDADGSVWAGRTRSLVRWRQGATALFGPAEGLPGLRVHAIHRDRHGSLWVGTEGGGIARLRGTRFE